MRKFTPIDGILKDEYNKINGRKMVHALAKKTSALRPHEAKFVTSLLKKMATGGHVPWTQKTIGWLEMLYRRFNR